MSTIDFYAGHHIREEPLSRRLRAVFLKTWDLGFTSFGGPPVHFLIFHRRFVEKYEWISERTFQELFALCQALPGPASTKMGYCICLTYAGFFPALLQFTLWCLPGCIGMYAIAIAVERIPDTLPDLVYAFLSGLNAATVGLIAVSAVTLSEKIISDQVSRIVVIGTACGGLLYGALWFFPALMIFGGFLTLAWDAWKAQGPGAIGNGHGPSPEEHVDPDDVDVLPPHSERIADIVTPISSAEILPTCAGRELVQENHRTFYGSPRVAAFLIALFFLSLTTVIVLRFIVTQPPMEYKLFSNLFLAGTILFGGGPVVVPLLNKYIVSEGWVSSRDFFIGLAAIQSFPGPNFNFAIFLSALSAKSSSSAPPIVLAALGFVGMFSPGMVLATGLSSLWQSIRRYKFVSSLLRGVNAAAIGLVWTAVYRLWQAGFLTADNASGASLSERPWWMIVAAVAFSGNKWFHIPPPVAIALGGCMGLVWWPLSDPQSI